MTVMVSKVTVKKQVHEHPDGHRAGRHRPRRARRGAGRRHSEAEGQRSGDHRSVWLDPSIVTGRVDYKVLFEPTARPRPRRFTRRCTTSRRSTGCWKTRRRVQHYFQMGAGGQDLGRAPGRSCLPRAILLVGCSRAASRSGARPRAPGEDSDGPLCGVGGGGHDFRARRDGSRYTDARLVLTAGSSPSPSPSQTAVSRPLFRTVGRDVNIAEDWLGPGLPRGTHTHVVQHV